ncbi:MAG TPA: Hsp20/alpha crystallin family protein [Candidatus Polarisedimenticolia bacterium]|nr:Hsp20/alpha crystallin family protein [Candidatus Polarisedimenticolia bacterium]
MLLRRIGPFDDLFDAFQGFDSLFPRVAGEARRAPAEFLPAVESFIRGEELVLRVELPGVDPSSVEVNVEGRRLTLRGDKMPATQSGDKNLYDREVAYGRFERTFTLPEGVKTDAIKAALTNGVLQITVPLPAAAGHRSVPIEAGDGTSRKAIKAA